MKANLRKEIIGKMKGLTQEEKASADQWLTEAFLAHPAYKEAQIIATYLSMKHEFQTKALIDQALADGKRVLVPKTFAKGRMIFVAYDPDDLVPTRFGLMEPQSQVAVPKEEIDLIHVPGVAFNPQHYRVGYGGGYYDRYLADYKGRTLSTIYSLQEADFEQATHDVAVNEVLVYES